MKILCINTQNIKVAREMIIRMVLKEGMQYVEMENEVLINTDILVRFNEELFENNLPLINLNDEKKDANLYKKIISYENIEDKKQNYFYEKNSKKRQKLQSQYVKTKIKQNRYLK
jgi:hypothetical protein